MSNETRGGGSFFGHPFGLLYLFFAELWERFSFYGMRAILTLYMTQQLFLEILPNLKDREELAIGIYAAYGALVYITPSIGGFLADKVLGLRKSIMLGGILMALGHFALAIEQKMVGLSFEIDPFFLGGLALIIAGNGFFKPNISTFVGTLYKKGDVRRDAGFNIFYMGINIGAFAAPIACDLLAVSFGWHWGFGAAGVGMVLGLLVFWVGMRRGVFGDRGHTPEGSGRISQQVVIVGSFLVVPLFALLLRNEHIVGYMLWGALLVAIGYIIYNMFVYGKEGALKLLSAVFLTFFMTIFWAFFEQAGSSITLFAKNNVNLPSWFGAGATNAINPGFIIIYAMVFSALWVYLDKRKKNPVTPLKYSLGLMQLGFGFLLFVFGAQFMKVIDGAAVVPFGFLVFGYMFHSTGELFLSPVGLSKMTELAPKKMASFMMGVWFMATSFGHYIAGFFAKLTAGEGKAEELAEGPFNGLVEAVSGLQATVVANGSESLNKLYLYCTVFTQMAVIAFGVGLFALIMTPFIKRWMGDVH